jgi:hypothetical protein
MVVGMIEISDDEKCKPIAGDFNQHACTEVRCGAHCLMEHIQGIQQVPAPYCPGCGNG